MVKTLLASLLMYVVIVAPAHAERLSSSYSSDFIVDEVDVVPSPPSASPSPGRVTRRPTPDERPQVPATPPISVTPLYPPRQTSPPPVPPRTPPTKPAPPRTDYGPASRAPIWPAFIKAFKQCEPGCEPQNYGTWRSGSGRSCHYQGLAVDVGAMRCSDDGRVHKSINGGRFEKMVRCMRTKMGKVLYRDGGHVTQGHHDHAHFSNGCNGGTYW